MPIVLTDALVLGELVGRDPSVDRQVERRRLQVLTHRHQVAARRRADPRAPRTTSSGRLAHPEDEVGLRDLAGRGAASRSAGPRASGRSRTPGGSGRADAGTVSRLCANTSGSASITVAMSRSPPLKSVGSTSTPHPGTASRTARMVAAQIRAPPSGRSSRATPVSTTNRSPICLHGLAIRSGSSSSTGSGRAVITSQKPQRRVHSIAQDQERGLALPPSTHRCSGTSPPRRPCAGRARRMIDVSSAWFGPDASRTLSHGRLASVRRGSVRSAAGRRSYDDDREVEPTLAWGCGLGPASVVRV